MSENDNSSNHLSEINTSGGTYVGRDVNVGRDFAGRDINNITNNYYQISPITDVREQKQLRILLSRVKQFWIDQVLDQSTHGTALIDLDKEMQTEAVTHAWEQILELPSENRQTLPPQKKIGHIFDEFNRSLLILGEPGSGKSVTILQLAKELIDKFETDQSFSEPVPVIFNLSSWSTTYQQLSEWIISELVAKYQIPERIGQQWLQNYYLVFLLDGLDEVSLEYRNECAQAVNQFAKEFGLSGIAVCCRSAAYSSLSIRLQLNGAVKLLPLTLAQVYDYLDKAGASLEKLRKTLEKDNGLQELALSPLTLGIMIFVYQTESSKLLEDNFSKNIDERRLHLFHVYVEHMLKRKGQRKKQYSDENTLRWLGWLARQMRQHNQSIFLIEQLQPDSLPKGMIRYIYLFSSRIVIGALIGFVTGLVTDIRLGLFCGIISGVCISFLSMDRFKMTQSTSSDDLEKLTMAQKIIRVITIGGMIWFILFFILNGFRGFAYGLPFGMIFAITFGLRNSPQNQFFDIRNVEALNWSWVRAVKFSLIGLGLGIVFDIIGESIFRLIFGFPIFGLFDWWAKSILLIAPLCGLSGAIFGGINSDIIPMKTIPNQGIRLSLRNSVFAGSITGVLLGLIIGITGDFWRDLIISLGGGLFNNVRGGITGGFIAGVTGGSLVALWYGGIEVIQHFLLRFLLFMKGYMPANYALFLQQSSDHIFVRQVGSGFVFIHRLLLEYFAELHTKPTELHE